MVSCDSLCVGLIKHPKTVFKKAKQLQIKARFVFEHHKMILNIDTVFLSRLQSHCCNMASVIGFLYGDWPRRKARC